MGAFTAHLEPARRIQRRIQARDRYRRRRDRKIAVDLLGRHFEHLFRSDRNSHDRLLLRLSSYNPNNHTVTLYPVSPSQFGQVVWDTDRFWSLRRMGELLDA